jgi:hypothetical protein
MLRDYCATLFPMTRTDLSLMLSGFSALAVLLGPLAAVVLVAFIAGLLLGSRRHEVAARRAGTRSTRRPPNHTPGGQ